MRFEKLVPIVVLARHLEEPLTHLARAVRVPAHVFHVPEAPEDREEAARLVDALAELAGPEVRGLDLRPRHPLDHHEDRAHVDVDVDGQHGPLPPVRQALERRQRALEVIERLRVGQARRRLDPRLPEVADGLVPDLAALGVVGDHLHVLGETVDEELLDGLDDRGMQRAAMGRPQREVGDSRIRSCVKSKRSPVACSTRRRTSSSRPSAVSWSARPAVRCRSSNSNSRPMIGGHARQLAPARAEAVEAAGNHVSHATRQRHAGRTAERLALPTARMVSTTMNGFPALASHTCSASCTPAPGGLARPRSRTSASVSSRPSLGSTSRVSRPSASSSSVRRRIGLSAISSSRTLTATRTGAS